MGKSTLGKDEKLYPGASLESNNGQFRADMQKDGNFVVYKGDKPVWSSNKQNDAGYVKMQSDGNLVVYDLQDVPCWASGSNSRYTLSSVTLKLTDVGKLVITADERELWSSS